MDTVAAPSSLPVGTLDRPVSTHLPGRSAGPQSSQWNSRWKVVAGLAFGATLVGAFALVLVTHAIGRSSPEAPIAPPVAATPTPTADSATSAPVATTAPSDEPTAAAVSVSAPQPPRKKKPNCTPSFWLDQDGNKHFKPECFR